MGCSNDSPVPREDPAGSGPSIGRRPVTAEDGDGGEATRRNRSDDEWRAARDEAALLARRLQYLTWPDRARVLDEFFWSRARATLSSEAVTAVINRKLQQSSEIDQVQSYARYCASVAATVLAVLDDSGPLAGEAHALTLMLSTREQHRNRALDWVATQRRTALDEQLRLLPGYAFLSLTCHPNDSAESFMARDAFWTAMLGNA